MTDIEAYVNGKQIPSMNIDGYTAVTAENLRYYGFEVAWSPIERVLNIVPAANQEIQGVAVLNDEQSLQPSSGAHWKNVLSTDIEVFYENRPLRSYNIEGTTALLLNDLEPFGELKWDEAKRQIRYTPSLDSNDAEPSAVGLPESNIKLERDQNIAMTIQFKDDGQYLGDKQIGFVEEGLPFFELPYFADAFGYQITRDGVNISVDEGLYSFHISPGSNQVGTYWGGQRVKTIQLYRAPLMKNGKLHLFSTDMERLFGYVGLWDQTNRRLDLRYDHYLVKDYGLPQEVHGDQLPVHLTVLDPGPFPYTFSSTLGLSLDNSGVIGNGGALSLGYHLEKYQGKVVAPFELPIALTVGTNHITEIVNMGERVLYRAAYDVNANFDSLPLEIDIANFSLDGNQHGYIRTQDPNLILTGKAAHGFYVQVRKWSEGKGFQDVKKEMQDIEIDAGGAFELPLSLDQGNGLYSIQILKTVPTPRGQGYMNVGHLYVTSLAKE
ncbi:MULTISPECIES: hypothetical protein [Paenibacillus]|uniref:hypothetical protein n=1 Tax=Paenibacillus TaxID=44249 RepID=UPI0022B85D08|nr:hypothetical protein [Paenibacillus caseinilyticus]MCZ8522669.1 hypothetical protein [Paenibacillus caseinilyticus]